MSEGSANRTPPTPAIEPDASLIGDWLHIEADGTVVVFTGKVEVGQHIRTSLAQAVAEELRLPLARARSRCFCLSLAVKAAFLRYRAEPPAAQRYRVSLR